MRANVFHGKNKIRIEEVPKPRAGVGEAVIRVTLTTICGTDLHIVRGEYPVAPGLVIGHEPVGVIEELGEGVSGYEIGDRVLVGAITVGGISGGAFNPAVGIGPTVCHAMLGGGSLTPLWIYIVGHTQATQLHRQASELGAIAKDPDLDASFERGLSEEYLALLAESYARFFYHYTASPVLTVNSENLNFVERDADFELLVSRIRAMKSRREFFTPSPKGMATGVKVVVHRCAS